MMFATANDAAAYFAEELRRDAAKDCSERARTL